MDSLQISNIAAVLIFFLHVAARGHVCRIFCELENVRAEKADTVLNRVLERANRRHHGNYREHADCDSEHGQAGAQLVHAKRTERHRDDFAKWHNDLTSEKPQGTQSSQSYNDTSSGSPITFRRMPCVNTRTLKLISRPTCNRVSFK